MSTNEDQMERSNKRSKTNNTLTDEIVKAWSNVGSDKDVEVAMNSTLELLNRQVEELIKSGLEAFHNYENTSSELMHLQETVRQKDLEIERLRGSEKQHINSLANLMKALEKSRAEAVDNSDNAVQLANYRTELATVTAERNKAKLETETVQRKLGLAEDDLKNQKKKYHSLLAEKNKIERDYAASQRATMSLSKSANLRNSADTEYHKRKIGELQNRIQSLQVVISEKNRQLEEYRRHSSKSSLAGVSRKRSL